MGLKHVTAFAALIAVSTPSLALDFTKDGGPSTMFYISMPLDTSLSKKERELSFGMQLQGKREYQAVNLDSKMFTFLPLGGLEIKWIVAAVVATGAAVAIGGGGGSTQAAQQTQQTQQQVAQQQVAQQQVAQQQVAQQQAAAQQAAAQQSASGSGGSQASTGGGTTGGGGTTTPAAPVPCPVVCPPK